MSEVRADPVLRRTARRLALQAAALIVVCLVAVATVQWLLVEQSSHRDARTRLAEVTGTIDKPSEAPRDVLVTIDGPAGESSSADLPEGLPAHADIAEVRRTGVTLDRVLKTRGHEYLVRTERDRTRVVQATLDRQPIEDESRRLIVGLAWAGLFGVLLALGLASWLARRAVRPMADTIALQRRFVADASHELRTPLTLLSTRVQLLARRMDREHPDLRDDLRGDVDGVVADTRNLTEILDELLLAVDTRQAQDRRPHDLAALTREAVASASAEAVSRGLELTLEADGTPLPVEVSAPAVRRAVLALVDNALDHAVSRVHVQVSRAGREARVGVEDDGPGIAPERIPHLFERFATSRAASEDPVARRHYGLGLALVSDIASAHGGRVTARNRSSDTGAVITLELPLLR